ncbi:MAG: c-type cytochrome biogenesis protein CcmI [Rhizobiaceae bacterium]|nr:c-type cytochrome biogenesis protein CcmI [Rhizobiaceae bacterium]
MLFWVITIVMLAIAVLSILLPLARRVEQSSNAVQPMDIYVDQLNELEAKVASDKTAAESLAQEKAEISRRILKQARTQDQITSSVASGSIPSIGASLIALVGLPVIVLATYLHTGSPGQPDQPLHARATANLENTSIDEMVVIAERHLAKNPDDAQGWSVLAGVYGRMNRPMDRARALQEIIRISGATPERLADLGEALTVAGDNIVPVRARQLFETAFKSNPQLAKAGFYLAIAQEQEGKLEEALARWTDLAALRVSDPEWKSMVARKQKEIRGKLGLPEPETTPNTLAGPSAEQVEDAANLSAADRAEMIEGMVANLASRLEDNPQDLPGWTRLIRSYAVLGKMDKAQAALKKAHLAFSNQDEIILQLQQQAIQLGLKPPVSKEENP